MGKTTVFAVLAVAVLFAWQYVENDHHADKPTGTNPPVTDRPIVPDTDDCPFYPSPQTIGKSMPINMYCMCLTW